MFPGDKELYQNILLFRERSLERSKLGKMSVSGFDDSKRMTNDTLKSK